MAFLKVLAVGKTTNHFPKVLAVDKTFNRSNYSTVHLLTVRVVYLFISYRHQYKEGLLVTFTTPHFSSFSFIISSSIHFFMFYYYKFIPFFFLLILVYLQNFIIIEVSIILFLTFRCKKKYSFISYTYIVV